MARILVVDDDSRIHEDWEPRLISRGHTVITALNGGQGLHLATAGHPDLIITDLVMPVMNGYDMVVAIRAAGLTMPILMSCGQLVETHRQMALNDGVTEVILKGESPDVLLAAIDRQLAKSGLKAVGTGGTQ
ncbi:MAG: response regulator [Patescibacteria group bacterium]